MKREEKTAWLQAASNDEVLNQMKWSVIAMTTHDNIAKRIEGQEDYELVIAELKRRLGQ